MQCPLEESHSLACCDQRGICRIADGYGAVRELLAGLLGHKDKSTLGVVPLPRGALFAKHAVALEFAVKSRGTDMELLGGARLVAAVQ